MAEAPDDSRRPALEASADSDVDQRLASLGRVAAMMAHEFNNVLMGIQPFVDVIAHGADAQTVEKAVRHMQLSIQRGKHVTAEVLRIARTSEPNLKSIRVREWLLSLDIELRALIPPSVTLHIDVEEGDEPMYASIDVDDMNQVLVNLVANAKDAMPSGGTVRVLATRCYSWSTFSFANPTTPDQYVRISVSDTGRGIDGATLDKIFEPLFTTKTNGTGLGLVVVKQMTERHGGTVVVESSVGMGTSFHLFIPAALAPDFDTLQEEPQRLEAPPHLRLLLVEDDRQVSTAMANALRAHGIETHVVHTGSRVAEAVRRFSPNAVVLDVGLPDMSGADVFWSVRRDFPRLPVVFSTGHADAESLKRAIAQPAVAFLRKPYTIGTLMDVLVEVVEEGDAIALPTADEVEDNVT